MGGTGGRCQVRIDLRPFHKMPSGKFFFLLLTGEAAERILAPEPDGSFVVRDSSDHHYIFR